MDATFHESDERLELYALQRLSDSDVIQIEEHLLVCESCRDRLEQNADFAIAMREAIESNPVPERKAWFGWLRPQLVFAGGLAVALLAMALVWNGRSTVNSVAVLQLAAMRGNAVATVHPARELDLTLLLTPEDAAGASAASVVEVLESGGAALWSGTPEVANGRVKVKVVKTLPAGDYLAQYYDSPGHLVHEYSFHVK